MTTDQFHEHVITRLDRIEALLQPRKSEAAARRQQCLRERKKDQAASTINATSVNTSLVNS